MNMYQGFSASAVALSSTIFLDAPVDAHHVVDVCVLLAADLLLARKRGQFGLGFSDLASRMRIAFMRRASCQPGCSVAAHSGSVGRSLRMSIADGVRWKT